MEVVQAACAGLSCMDRRVDAVGKMLLHDDSAVKAGLPSLKKQLS